MYAVRPQTPTFTPEEYLAHERAAEHKSEYIDGEIVAMAGGSPAHNAITFNISVLLGAQLRGKPCRGFSSDMKVATGPRGLYVYPDISVVCGEPRFHDEHQDTLVNPTLVVEVLSPSTELSDRGVKWMRYQRIESLTDYLLVAQDEPRVEHYARQADDRWLLTTARGREAGIEISSLGCRLSLSEVYDKVTFDAADPEGANGLAPPPGE